MGKQLVIFIALVATGCAPDYDELPPITWEGEHLRYGSDDPDAPICAGTLPSLDEHAGALKVEFGAPAELVVDYYFITDTSADFWFCPGEAPACAWDSVILSTIQTLEHEVVHAVAQGADLHAHDFLSEGLAGAYAQHSHHFLPDLTVDDALERFEDGEGLGHDGYLLSRHFVAWLLDEYGVDDVLDVMRGTSGYDTSTSSIDDALQTVTGEGLVAVVERYETEAVACDYQKHRNDLVDCQAVDFVLEETTEYMWSAEADIDWSASCDDATTIGPRWGLQWRSWTFDIPADAGDSAKVYPFIYGGEADGPAGWGWNLVSCAECEGEIDMALPFYDGGQFVGIPPGRYVLSAYVDAGETRPLAATVFVSDDFWG